MDRTFFNGSKQIDSVESIVTNGAGNIGFDTDAVTRSLNWQLEGLLRVTEPVRANVMREHMKSHAYDSEDGGNLIMD